MTVFESGSEEETRRFGEALLAELWPQGVLLLEGDLGSGKTVLAQGLARGLGIDPRQVQSPTFTLVREHAGVKGRLVHVDLYRLEPAEAAGVGLEELLAGPGIKVVEWAERLPFTWPGALRFKLERVRGIRGQVTNSRRIRNLSPNSEEEKR